MDLEPNDPSRRRPADEPDEPPASPASPTPDPFSPPNPDPLLPPTWTPPAPARGPRSRTRTIALVAGGLLVAVVALFGFVTFLDSQLDERDALTRDLGRRLLEMPEFEARFGNETSPEAAFQLGQELAATGFARLDDPSLRRFWELTLVMWDATEDDVCAAIIRQTITPAQAQATMKLLPVDQYAEMLDLTYRAFEAELKGTPGPPEPGPVEVDSAYTALAAQMGDQEMVETADTMVSTTAADHDVCVASRSFLHEVLRLPEGPKATLLRFMAYP